MIALLQREKRVLYRELAYIFDMDEVLLEEIRKALSLKRLAIDEGGQVLVWTGETPPVPRPAMTPTQPPAFLEATTLTSPAPTDTPSNGPTAATAIRSDELQDEPAVTPQPARSAPEAERRQLTVMFCDLAD
ncbi:MAG: hypothetical protein V3U27_10810, partial [Candidatus Tectomicrobia bacterium]